MDIADDLTVQSGKACPDCEYQHSWPVGLTCLPGLDRQLAQAIISYRQSSGFFPNTAHLLKVQGMTSDRFKQAAPRVCRPSGDISHL
jgi:hypothetical protein